MREASPKHDDVLTRRKAVTAKAWHLQQQAETELQRFRQKASALVAALREHTAAAATMQARHEASLRDIDEMRRAATEAESERDALVTRATTAEARALEAVETARSAEARAASVAAQATADAEKKATEHACEIKLLEAKVITSDQRHKQSDAARVEELNKLRDHIADAEAKCVQAKSKFRDLEQAAAMDAARAEADLERANSAADAAVQRVQVEAEQARALMERREREAVATLERRIAEIEAQESE